ncbi:MAG: hypothetical protein IGQ88_04115 [Gloeomargaritaceae cyanobacterium C42_A2020_066]|nr:hypothetical protein [Gloeomargaritaceae cyanobacterium C42_A2020_066]
MSPHLDIESLRQQVSLIQQKRPALVALLNQPDLGILRIDVTQALEELDDLLAEFKSVFPQLDLN